MIQVHHHDPEMRGEVNILRYANSVKFHGCCELMYCMVVACMYMCMPIQIVHLIFISSQKEKSKFGMALISSYLHTNIIV